MIDEDARQGSRAAPPHRGPGAGHPADGRGGQVLRGHPAPARRRRRARWSRSRSSFSAGTSPRACRRRSARATRAIGRRRWTSCSTCSRASEAESMDDADVKTGRTVKDEAAATTGAAVKMGAAVTTIDLPVKGMHCAACVGKVERALSGVPGVRIGAREPRHRARHRHRGSGAGGAARAPRRGRRRRLPRARGRRARARGGRSGAGGARATRTARSAGASSSARRSPCPCWWAACTRSSPGRPDWLQEPLAAARPDHAGPALGGLALPRRVPPRARARRREHERPRLHRDRRRLPLQRGRHALAAPLLASRAPCPTTRRRRS